MWKAAQPTWFGLCSKGQCWHMYYLMDLGSEPFMGGFRVCTQQTTPNQEPEPGPGPRGNVFSDHKGSQSLDCFHLCTSYLPFLSYKWQLFKYSLEKLFIYTLPLGCYSMNFVSCVSTWRIFLFCTPEYILMCACTKYPLWLRLSVGLLLR